MDVRQPHRPAFVREHANNCLQDPTGTAIAPPLALDWPWLGIARAQPLEPLGQVAQPGAVSRCQDLRNFCHKIARSTRILVRYYLRRPHQIFRTKTTMPSKAGGRGSTHEGPFWLP